MIIPSLDFIQGKIVRLYQGKYSHKMYYENNTIQQIDQYIKHGSKYIHLVDLDGCDQPMNRQKSILKIISYFNNKIDFQVGGGIRSEKDIQDLLDMGVSKIVIGTSAILFPDRFKEWLKKYGCNNFVLAVDVHINHYNEKKIAIHGWKTITNIDLDNIICYFFSYGLKNILCTDISRDGTFAGPNIDLYKSLKEKFPYIILQSSGGISSLSDLCRLKASNVEHVIIGRALLENKFTFLEAKKCWQKE